MERTALQRITASYLALETVFQWSSVKAGVLPDAALRGSSSASLIKTFEKYL